MRQVKCQLLLWEEDWSDVPSPDVIIASDVIYDPEAFPALVAVLKHLLLRRRPSVSALPPASATPSANPAGGTSDESSSVAAELPSVSASTPAAPGSATPLAKPAGSISDESSAVAAELPSVCASAPGTATPSANQAGGISDESSAVAAELPDLPPQSSPVAYLSAQIRTPTSVQSFKDLLTSQGLEWSLIDLQAANCSVQFDHLSLREDIDQVLLMRIVAARTLC